MGGGRGHSQSDTFIEQKGPFINDHEGHSVTHDCEHFHGTSPKGISISDVHTTTKTAERQNSGPAILRPSGIHEDGKLTKGVLYRSFGRT